MSVIHVRLIFCAVGRYLFSTILWSCRPRPHAAAGGSDVASRLSVRAVRPPTMTSGRTLSTKNSVVSGGDRRCAALAGSGQVDPVE